MPSIHKAVESLVCGLPGDPSFNHIKIKRNAPKFLLELGGEYVFGSSSSYRLPFDECFVFVSGEGSSGILYYAEQVLDVIYAVAMAIVDGEIYRPVQVFLHVGGDYIVAHLNGDLGKEEEAFRDAYAGPIKKFLDLLAEPSAKLVPSHNVTTSCARKRESKGKAPLIEYKTLVIDKKVIDSQSRGGHHASPRLHLRRGHFRQLKIGGVVWVRPAIVGEKNRGMVVKDYRVATA